jgi:hypothetical protein
MLTPEMRDAISQALDFQRKFMSDGTHALAHAVQVLPDKSVNMYAFDDSFFADWREKNKIGLHLIHALFQRGGGAIAFVCEGWAGHQPEHVSADDLPTDLGEWPAEYRSECLFATANQIGHKGVFVEQRFTRKPNGKPQWGKVDWAGHRVMAGRFMYDLTSGDVRRAIHDVLHVGRDGMLDVSAAVRTDTIQ